MKAEVSKPLRAAPLRRAGRPAGGRRLWRCASYFSPAEGTESLREGSSGPAAVRPRRVLVIDDERAMRMLCRVNLNAAGMDVVEAENGLQGLELARRELPDLVLLDVMMPDVDGWSVARELAAAEETRDIPVVFLTARADPADRRLGEQVGGVGYVVKPFDPVSIGEVVEEVLVRIERGEREELRREITSGPDR